MYSTLSRPNARTRDRGGSTPRCESEIRCSCWVWVRSDACPSCCRSGSDGALTNLIDIRHPDLQHDGHASLRTHTQHEHRISDSHLGVEPPRSRVRAFGLDSVEYIFQEVQ